jgi:CRP-like cAMP-binding protein
MSFKICEGINKPTLSQLSFYLKEKSYKRKFTVFREGQTATGLYFIKSGEFEISKTIEGLD